MATIEIHYRDGRSERRTLAEGTLIIGREAGDIVLDDPLVSGTHGELRLTGGGELFYEDRGSSNGSFDGQGTPLQGKVRLSSGAILKLGECRIVVEQVAAKKPLKGRTMVMGSAPIGSPPMPPMPAPAPKVSAPGEAPSPAASANPSAPPEAAEPAAAPSQVPTSAAPSSPPEAATQSDNVWDMDESPPSAGDAPSEPPLEPAGVGGLGLGPGLGLPKVEPLKVDPAQAFGRSVDTPAGRGMQDFAFELKHRISWTWRLFRPYLEPLVRTVGIVVVPFALLQIVLGFIPLLGAFTALLLAPIEAIVLTLWVHGIIAQAANQLTGGEPLDLGRARAAHRSLLVPWSIMWLVALVPILIAMVCMAVIILFPVGVAIALVGTWALIPAFVLEDRRGSAPIVRSYQLFRADWLHLLQGLAIVMLGTAPVWLATILLAMVPVVGPLAGAVTTALLTPFVTLYVFGLFKETRTRVENAERQSTPD